MIRLGKRPARIDKRNIKLANILKVLPPIPEEYDFDGKHIDFNIPTPMFANDIYGNCVIASTAHQTLRFEVLEQKKVIAIKDEDVINQYFKESGGVDSGLYMLKHMKEWRNNGWRVGGRKLLCLNYSGHIYKIDAFAQVNALNHDEVRAGIYLLTGLNVGLMLPISAQHQIGGIWDIVPGYEKSFWGGHAVYVHAYNEMGPVCITWGATQQITWSFWDRYCDECYAIVDAINPWVLNSVIDIEKLRQYLREIT